MIAGNARLAMTTITQKSFSMDLGAEIQYAKPWMVVL